MKTRIATFMILLGAFFALTCGDCPARQIEEWPYDKLFKNADLVVILKPVSVRDATEKDKAVPPDPGKDFMVGIVTKFKVLHVVKGEYKEKELELIHFKLKEGAMVNNGPVLVSFHMKSVSIKGDDWAGGAANDYMLFLKAGKDKRLDFVSGQFDPDLSVKQMTSPLP
jgi:hypothetical protein